MTELTGSSKAQQWRTYLDVLETFRDRLMGVVIENKPAIKVIDQQDTEQTLFFADPPYVPSTRLSGKYKFEMTAADHELLCERLAAVKGMVVLCGYENEIYNRLGWEKHNLKTTAMDASDRTEVIWLNKAAQKASSQASLF